MEYASPVWDPHTATNIAELEAVQRRTARFVKDDYHTTSSTSQMIKSLGWQSLDLHRTNAKLVTMYRVVHNLVDIPAEQFLKPTTSSMSTRGATQKYLLPYCRTDVYRFSFFPSAVRLWNQLQVQLTEVDSVEAFKSGLPSTL
jgi:hypothetical protein